MIKLLQINITVWHFFFFKRLLKLLRLTPVLMFPAMHSISSGPGIAKISNRALYSWPWVSLENLYREDYRLLIFVVVILCKDCFYLWARSAELLRLLFLVYRMRFCCRNTTRQKSCQSGGGGGNKRWLNSFPYIEVECFSNVFSTASCWDTFLVTLAICLSKFSLLSIVTPRRVRSSLTGIVVLSQWNFCFGVCKLPVTIAWYFEWFHPVCIIPSLNSS